MLSVCMYAKVCAHVSECMYMYMYILYTCIHMYMYMLLCVSEREPERVFKYMYM